MGLTGMGSTPQGVAVVIFLCQRRGEITEPLVVRRRLADPARARMILVGGLIAMDTGLRRRRGIYVRRRAIVEDILSRPEELRRFEKHLDDVFVAVPLGGDLGVQVEKEDIHLDVLSALVPQHHQVFAALRRDETRNCTSGTKGSATGNRRTIAHDEYNREQTGVDTRSICPQ